jgi:pimeloyl-ACP methyl ester carboxylesterase
MASLPVHLVSAATPDGVTLHGAFLAAFPEPRPSGFDAVLLMHGVANAFYVTLSPLLGEAFARCGYASVQANNRGHDIVTRGTATQPYLGAAFERLQDSVLDWEAWYAWLAERGYRRILVAGHSLGGVKTAHVLAQGAHPLVAGCALFSPPRFTYTGWLAGPRAAEFRDHLARAQALVDAGTPDALFEVTMPTKFIAGASAYLAKYGPDAQFDIFANVVRIGVPVIAFTGDREFGDIAFGDHPAQYEAAGRAKADLVHHVVPDGNHYYHGQEAWVIERLLAWMEEVAPAS